ncbi:outer dynein arm-docking complex subunit 4-like [Watersipora subatra]|uniref:outer dynein arm-docking complex subunit 4-like n=1 Tax=Watersipora subatra TaxID=2589382 RepID=UPI00355BBDAC
MYDGEGSDNGPKGTYEIYRAEGDALYKQGNYRKSIESYSLALEIREGDRACLVARSRCHLQLGDNAKALEDAETCLSDDPEYHKGIFAKAEALYCKGEFELALVFYHRGNKLRPELHEFRLGIQKAKEAIDNAVGTPQAVKLTKEGDLSFFAKQDEKTKLKKPGASFTYGRATAGSEQKKRPPPKSGTEKTVRQLLGELYGDKEFLEKLLKETDTSSKNGQQIYDLACDGLHYLDTRTDFWRQQKPMYSRKREKQDRLKGKQKKGNHENYVMIQLERIDQDQVEGKPEESLKRAQKTLTYVQNLNDSDISNYKEITASLYSCIGNAYLEMGNYKRALVNHNKDLDLANENDLTEAKSRALDNLGRVHARSGEFAKAIEVWEDKVPMSKSALESTWLFHEIGRCYLESGRFDVARGYGERALEAAHEAHDDEWKLHAGVLIAQALVKLQDYKGAAKSFEEALELSRDMNDEVAENAIKSALNDVNKKMAHQTEEVSKASDPEQEQNDGKQQEQSEETEQTGEQSAAPEELPTEETTE